MGNIGVGRVHLQKMGFLEEKLSDGLEKMQVTGPRVRYAYVEQFRVITKSTLENKI
jgi:hypothetical protein